MFKKSKRKIVLSIMLIMGFLLVGTLCVIYITSYMEVYNKNQEMLERYIEAYSRNGNPDQQTAAGGLPLPQGDLDLHPESDSVHLESDGVHLEVGSVPKKLGEERIFQLSTFYSVAYSNGEIVGIDDNGGTVYTERELSTFAAVVIDKEKKEGLYGSFIYRIGEGKGYTLVAFMDNTIVQESTTSLFKYTVIYAGAAFVIIFILSRILAKRIVMPMEDTYYRQKQFISDAGHELKTPVSAIGANVEMLTREIGTNPWLLNIQLENDRMAVMIRQLLELARTEQVAPPKTQTCLGRIVRGEVLALEPLAFEKGLKFSDDEIDENIIIEGNEEQLRQLVSILLDNAIEHSAAGGEVSVSLSAKGRKASLTVANTGEEIPKEQRELIFERFYRGDFSRTGGENHYGLGLAIAKAIVTAHGGNISVGYERGQVIFTVILQSNFNLSPV